MIRFELEELEYKPDTKKVTGAGNNPMLTLDYLQNCELRDVKTLLCEGRQEGDVIRYARKALGLKQKELATVLGYTHETVSRWENNKETVPRSAAQAIVGVLTRAIDGEDAQDILATVDHGATSVRRAPRVGVAVLLRREDGALLIGKRIGPYGGGTWSVPGGKLEQGESPLSCAKRELLEETGIRAPLAMTTLWTWDGDDPQSEDYVTLWAEGYVEHDAQAFVCEPEKCAEWRWVPLGEMPTPLFRCMQTFVDAGGCIRWA